MPRQLNYTTRLVALATLALLVELLPCQVDAGLQAPPLRGNLGAHDPGSIIKCKDKYYIFATGTGIASKSSTDKIFWNSGPNVFAHPANWTTNAAPGFTDIIWAPDVIYLNGRYCLYYAVSTLGSQQSGIGLVTNPTLDPSDPSYLWTDQGPVIISTNGSAYNTIDPSVTLDAAGNPWLVFGSYWQGIYILQLDPVTGLRIAPNSPLTRLAYNSSIEASSIFRHGGYYYLMVNWDSCCAGVNSGYNIRMGRSTSITGPYLDKNGVDMVNNGGMLFLQGTGKFAGPGHFAILNEGGSQWFSYHYYDAGAYAPWYGAYGVADFDLEPLSWTADNWPYFTNDWSAIYNFQSDARDENGQYYGLLQNGASIQNDATRGRVLNLNGTNQYAQLPPGVAFARTFSAVVKWNGGGAWQRIFDFGVDTSDYVMLTPLTGDTSKMRCDIRINNVTQTITAPAALPTNVWTHVALTLDGQKGIIYSNGVPVVTNNITFSPLQTLAQTNYLGRSMFVADPYFNGQIANFRVYGRALSATEIAAPQPLIAQPADGSKYWPGTTLSFNGSATDLTDLTLGAAALSWRIEFAEDGITNIVFGPVAGTTSGSYNIPTNATSGTYQIILVATDSAGRKGTNVATISPANPPNGWSSYYPFKANANDANGHFNGALNGGASIQNDVTRGNVLNLSGSSQFVSLPAGVSKMQTFMGWVKWNGGGAWQRIFDFGNDTIRYAVLTPSAGNGKLRFNISLNSNVAGAEQIADAPWALPTNIWTHVAVTMDGDRVVLYTNGVPVVTNANIDLVPANMNATNNYLGKSQWPDPYFSGQLSSVRIFSSALSPAAIVAPQISISQPAQGSIYRPGDTINFSGSANDFADATLSSTGLTWTVQWRFTTTNTIIAPLSGVTNGSFTIPSSGSSATNGSYRIMLVTTDSSARKSTNYTDIFPAAAANISSDWASYYPFTSNANDSSNLYNGTLFGGAGIQVDATRGNVLNLPGGANQYTSFATGISSLHTFGGWVKWRGGAMWQRIFDFGQDTQRFFFLSPYVYNSNMQCAITAQASNYTQVIEAAQLPLNTWTHVAVVLDGRQGILYTNGQVAAVNNSINLLPSDLGATKNYFGKSQFGADAYFNGQLDSVKVNSRALTPAEIFAPSVSITQPTISTLYAGGNNIAYAGVARDYSDALLPASSYAWSAIFSHDGIIDPFMPVVRDVTNGNISIPTTGPATTNVFYRVNLTATDTNGNSQSTSVDVQPRLTTLNFATVPPGLMLNLDGQSMNAPTSVVRVAGMTRTLSAPSPQNLSGSNYDFVVWSHGGAQTHNVSVPTNATTYTASYVLPTVALSNSPGTITLQWPTWAAPFSVWSTTNLAPTTTWTQITSPLTTNAGNLLLNLATTNDSRFFRLQFP